MNTIAEPMTAATLKTALKAVKPAVATRSTLRPILLTSTDATRRCLIMPTRLPG